MGGRGNMSSGGGEADEDVALRKEELFVYKVPPLTSATGHKAADWKEQVAVVNIEVVTKGKDYFVRLLRADNGKVFAVAPQRNGGPTAVEQTVDSSRYFCLRIENDQGASCWPPALCGQSPGPFSPRRTALTPSACLPLPAALLRRPTPPPHPPLPSPAWAFFPCAGKHAFIGIAFNKREDAFDLKSVLADIERGIRSQEKGIDLGLGDVSNDLLAGFSAGQTVAITMGGKKPTGAVGGGAGAGAAAAERGSGGGGGGFKLAPPGSASLLKPGAAAGAGAACAAPAAVLGAGGGGLDIFGGAGGGAVKPAAPAPAPAKPASAPAPATEWETF